MCQYFQRRHYFNQRTFDVGGRFTVGLVYSLSGKGLTKLENYVINCMY